MLFPVKDDDVNSHSGRFKTGPSRDLLFLQLFYDLIFEFPLRLAGANCRLPFSAGILQVFP